MIYNYIVDANGIKTQKKFIISDLLFSKIKEERKDFNDYIHSKLLKYQWSFDTIETYSKIITEIEAELS